MVHDKIPEPMIRIACCEGVDIAYHNTYLDQLSLSRTFITYHYYLPPSPTTIIYYYRLLLSRTISPVLLSTTTNYIIYHITYIRVLVAKENCKATIRASAKVHMLGISCWWIWLCEAMQVRRCPMNVVNQLTDMGFPSIHGYIPRSAASSFNP